MRYAPSVTVSNHGVLVVADSASQLAPARRLADAVANPPQANAARWPVHVVTLEGEASPSERQVSAAGGSGEVQLRRLSELVNDPRLLMHDAVVAMLPGSRLFRLRRGVESLATRLKSSRRPVLVTGYNGIVYEGAQEGILWRLGYDVVCVNSAEDYRLFERVCRNIGVSSSSLIVSGVLMAANEKASQPQAEAAVHGLVFAPQAAVPPRRVERVYILKRLIEYANRYPEREVTIKLRTIPGERTFHVERFPYPELLRQEVPRRETPPNLKIKYGSMRDHLTPDDLLVTVSSTAVFEALSLGVRACVLEDFGLRERMGTHVFAGSGLTTNFGALLDDRLPTPDPVWLKEHGLGGDALLQRVSSFVREQRVRIAETPPSFLECYYTAERTPHVFTELVRGDNPEDEIVPNAWTLWTEELLDRAHRKAKKLVRDPRQFAKDTGLYRAFRRERLS